MSKAKRCVITRLKVFVVVVILQYNFFLPKTGFRKTAKLIINCIFGS